MHEDADVIASGRSSRTTTRVSIANPETKNWYQEQLQQYIIQMQFQWIANCHTGRLGHRATHRAANPFSIERERAKFNSTISMGNRARNLSNFENVLRFRASKIKRRFKL